jgi:transposase-like protein
MLYLNMKKEKTDKQINSILDKHKTLCCQSTYTRQGRAKYVCDSCGKDVSLELVLLFDAISPS